MSENPIYRVTAAAVQVSSPGKDGMESHVILKGLDMPSGVPQDDIDRLLDLGMVQQIMEEVEVDQTEEAPDKAEETPNLQALSNRDLRIIATERGIDLDGAKSKAEILAILEA